MIELGILLLTTSGLGPDAAEVDLYRGRCDYRSEVISRAADAVLVSCDTFSIATDGVRQTYDFGRGSGERMIRFEGASNGDDVEVDSITLRNGRKLPAKGHCEIFRRDGASSVVSCLGTAKGVPYAANFVRSRI